VSDWKPIVDTFTTWAGEPRVTVTLKDGRWHALTKDEATALVSDLNAALADIAQAHPDDAGIVADGVFDEEGSNDE
jgi:hypothetical protein